MKKYLRTSIVIVIVAVIAFYGGLKYGESKNSGMSLVQGSSQNFQVMDGNGTGRRGNFTNGGFVNGQILSVNPQGLTVQFRDGSSKIIFVSSSTPVMKSTVGTASDLTVGEDVTIVGTANTDGSLTAQSVQIRPTGQNQFGR